jgi:gluconate 2-dehydrogenase gamma chain
MSRATLLRRAGLIGVAAAVPAGAAATSAAPPQRERLETFTAAEADVVEAMLERLIPSDASGPGATEARVLRYVDKALDGDLASSRAAYTAGIADTDAYARSRFGAGFADLTGAQQDTVLTEMENGTAPGLRTFFELVREHGLQGMFGDPVHGGNEDFAGWDLLGFTGVKMVYTEAEQQLDVAVVPAHKSAVDYPLWSGARGTGSGKDHHGHS